MRKTLNKVNRPIFIRGDDELHAELLKRAESLGLPMARIARAAMRKALGMHDGLNDLEGAV